MCNSNHKRLTRASKDCNIRSRYIAKTKNFIDMIDSVNDCL